MNSAPRISIRPAALKNAMISHSTLCTGLRAKMTSTAEAMVKVRVDGQLMHTAGEGNGPVNALDNAMRKALTPFFPRMNDIRLTDYKVRIVDEASGTAATPRVMIDSSDGEATWTTVGSSTNIIEASWLALADSYEYGLQRARR